MTVESLPSRHDAYERSSIELALRRTYHRWMDDKRTDVIGLAVALNAAAAQAARAVR